MTTAVFTLQNELKATIQTAADANAFALPVCVHVDDSTSAPPPTPDDAMDLQIAFVSAAQIARSTNRILDQAIVNVNLTYRHPDNNQAGLNDCHAVAETLRSLLTEFRTSTARVEQLLTPSPFDQPAERQGIYSHVIGLDCDVLRTLTAYSATAIDPKPLLTTTREAVWNAINNWPAFTDVWARKFQSMEDIEELALHDPGVADLPALAVTVGPTDPKWWVNSMQQWTQSLFVTCWLPIHQFDVVEWRLLQLMQAVYQSAPTESPGVSYIRRAVGRPPTKNSPVTLEPVALGRSQQLHAWRGTIALNLTANLDPNE